MAWYFAFFLLSGFCSILYELIWLRLSMAQFGVTTALVSIVLSVFMAGLGFGSYVSGLLIRRYGERIQFPPLRLYALAELCIGISALAVPIELRWGHVVLEHLVGQSAMSSAAFSAASAAWLVLTMVPWCACMGATIPLAMFAIRRDPSCRTNRSFSFLYLANVLGAIAGAIFPLFLIELHGFHNTLRVGALLNLLIAICAIGLTLRGRTEPRSAANAESSAAQGISGGGTLALLFITGLATMGMEVVWIRLFTPYIGPVVYSFAMILVAYLVATFAGSQIYRRWSRHHDRESALNWVALSVLGVLPLLTADARVPLHLVARVFLGIMPFASLIGFLTPMLVDRWSGGDPDRAGRAYAVNVLGCIAGPLVAGFLLLPFVGERVTMILFVVPWMYMASKFMAIEPSSGKYRSVQFRAVAAVFIFTTLVIFSWTRDYETQFAHRQVLRDETATVIATGSGMKRQLLINGIGMTSLTPVTKMMAHLTLSSLERPPHNVLVICFGMGTTHRAVLSWGIESTVVELVPSVPKLFSYYHEDGDQVLASTHSHVISDDGRRYLERSPDTYDAIIVDPPPPVQTAGSSLLYSQNFYDVAKKRLRPGGIMQQWLPEGDNQVQSAVARSLQNSFPYVRVFRSVEHGGWHFLASMSPIPARTSAELVARMPAAAVKDMMEWGPAATPDAQMGHVLAHEMTTATLIALSPATPPLQDDRPINEYFLLRTPLSQLMSMEDEAAEEAKPVPR